MFDVAAQIDRLADDVDDTAERAVADGHGNRIAGVGDLLATDQAFGRVHGNGAHGVFAEMLGNFEHEAVAPVVGFKRVQDRRQVIVELHVDDSAHNLADPSNRFIRHQFFLVAKAPYVPSLAETALRHFQLERPRPKPAVTGSTHNPATAPRRRR